MNIETFITTTATALVPVVLAIVGYLVTVAVKQSENRVKYVELAVSVLKVAPNKDTEALRNWAIEVLDQQSPVPLTRAAIEQLKRQPIQSSGTLSGNAPLDGFSASGGFVGSVSPASAPQ